MAVYKPTRKGDSSKFYVCEFVYQGKRFQESTGATSKTVAKEYEKRRKAEMERAAAGLPTEQKATRIRTVADIVEPYLLQQGFVSRTPRGRVLTLKAYRHLGVSGPARSSAPELPIFDDDDGESGAA